LISKSIPNRINVNSPKKTASKLAKQLTISTGFFRADQRMSEETQMRRKSEKQPTIVCRQSLWAMHTV
jgi:hypothetical protein